MQSLFFTLLLTLSIPFQVSCVSSLPHCSPYSECLATIQIFKMSAHFSRYSANVPALSMILSLRPSTKSNVSLFHRILILCIYLILFFPSHVCKHTSARKKKILEHSFHLCISYRAHNNAFTKAEV